MTSLGNNFFIPVDQLNITNTPLDAVPLRIFIFTLSPFPVAAAPGIRRSVRFARSRDRHLAAGAPGDRRIQGARPMSVPAVETQRAIEIEVRNLNAWYGKSQALFDISLTVQRQSVTALIGPSGCGKSTFVRCLNRMHEEIAGARAEGTVLVDGNEHLWALALTNAGAPAHRDGVPAAESPADEEHLRQRHHRRATQWHGPRARIRG